MRRRDKEVRERDAVQDVLARGEVLRLAMIDAEGAPYLVPLSYVSLPPEGGEPLRIVFHCAPGGRKVTALRRDPRVCFEVTIDAALLPADKVCDFTVRFRSVIGRGRAAFLSGPERLRALSLLAARYAGRPAAVTEAEAAGIEVVEIRVDEATCKASPPPGRGKG